MLRNLLTQNNTHLHLGRNALEARRTPAVTHFMSGGRNANASSPGGGSEGQESSADSLVGSHAFSPGGQALCNQRLCNVFPTGI